MIVSRSSDGQDKFVLEYYNTENGFFVELGAHDGLLRSNTYMLETIGWNGLCIEPSINFNELCKNRKCITSNALIFDDSTSTAKFIDCKKDMQSGRRYSQRSGIYDHRIRPGRAITKGFINKQFSLMQIKTLTEVLDEINAPKMINYLSIDTEGSELFVLRGINFTKYRIPIITIERGWPTYPKSTKLLTELGYELVKSFVDDDAWILPRYIHT